MALPSKFSSRAVMIVCAVVILLAGYACRPSEAKFHEQKRRTVAITNSLGNGTELIVHCKQKGEDLGAHTLGANEQYTFSFKTNFFGTNLYFCTFHWPGKCHWFDIFDMSRDHDQCNFCGWLIMPDGPCRLGQSNANHGCFRWNKDSC